MCAGRTDVDAGDLGAALRPVNPSVGQSSTTGRLPTALRRAGVQEEPSGRGGARESYPAPGPLGMPPTCARRRVEEDGSVVKPSCSSFELPRRGRGADEIRTRIRWRSPSPVGPAIGGNAETGARV